MWSSPYDAGVAERRHRHRDVWIALVGSLIVGGLTLSVAVWAAEKGSAHVGFWPLSGEITGLVLAGVGVYLTVALVRGWPLPGGFEPGDQTKPRASRLPVEDSRIAALHGLITEGRRLETSVPDHKTWTMADKVPDSIYRALAEWDERAAEVLDPAWLERFRKGSPLPKFHLLRGPYARVDHTIQSRLRVLHTVIEDLQERGAAGQ
jgi:hypothetical protein